jgi:hypothetical protein
VLKIFRVLLKYARLNGKLKYEPKESCDNFSLPGLENPMRIPASIAKNFSKNCFRGSGDKSAFLRAAGYTLDNADRLLDDLRSQILPLDAIPLESRKFGQYYEIRGTLSGPTGVVRAVRSIWITEHLSGITKFVTLTPDKRSTT